jgi:putative methanogen marker protein 4
MNISHYIIQKAKLNKAKIAIGADIDCAQKVITSAECAQAKGYAEVTIISKTRLATKVANIVVPNPAMQLISLLKQEKIDGVVRGTLGIEEILQAFYKQFHIKKLFRIALLKTPSGKMFFMTPVGIDDGWTLKDKVKLAINGAKFIKKLGIKPTIGILSGGRLEDKWRSKRIARSLATAEKLATALTKHNISAEHMQILFEEAVKTKNFIIPPDGINGNLMFRSLCLVGKGTGLGAPLIGSNIIYVDTSRANATYDFAIALASALKTSASVYHN